MKTRKYAAVAALAIVATATTAVVANASPAPAPSAAPRVSYSEAWAPDHTSLTATLSSGHFAVTPTSLEVLGTNGAVLAKVPTQYPTLTLRPTLSATAKTVTLRSNKPVPRLRDIGAVGAVGGVVVGCLIGGLIGLIFLVVPAIPGCVIGAVIGGAIGLVAPV